MGKWVHRLSNLDIEARTAYCASCGPITVQRIREGKYGCARAKNRRSTARKRPYTKSKKKTCERCGFVPEDSCQLEVDHIDGNHKNNDLGNLQTLCANCHVLKHRVW